MNKRFRLLVVLALIGVSIFFIYPTVQWYFFMPEEMKVLAASGREQIREYSRDEARGALSVLKTGKFLMSGPSGGFCRRSGPRTRLSQSLSSTTRTKSLR